MLFHKKVVILQPQVENSSCRWNSLAPAFAASETRNEPSPLGKHIERWRRDS